MANTSLFASLRSRLAPAASVRNEAGGLAYARRPESALALYAATGCLNGTFYASADEQLDYALQLSAAVDAGFVAKTAIYARQHGHMKDMPALLLASLSLRDGESMERAFGRVIDNGRMLRNFVQILRSGRVGRRSLGSRPKRLVRQWIENATVEQLLAAAIGNDPSLADVIKMVRPKPADAQRAALYAWLIGKPCDESALPRPVREYEAFKRDPSGPLPKLPFQYFSSLPLSPAQWAQLARGMSWQSLRMNLNTLQRNGVFADPAMVYEAVARLTDAEAIGRARVFPYQLMSAYSAGDGLPAPILAALQDAMEIATRQVPTLEGEVVVAVDVSGSMGSPVTGYRPGATSKVRCVDVAALIAACIQRNRPGARVLPFDTEVRSLRLNPRDSVMTQAGQLAALCGGGTCVSAPFAELNRAKAQVDLMVLVSDNESWRDTRRGGATSTMREWAQIKARNPQARLVCIDLQPVATAQTVESADVLHVGGFSDAVFDLIAVFAAQGGDSARWAERIGSVPL